MAPDFSQGMSLQMSQRLEMVMTPQMIQSMEMLQLPILALEQRIQQELLENPALEMLDLAGDPGDRNEDNSESPEPDESLRQLDEANDDLRKVDEIDYDWDNYYDEAAPRRVNSGDDDERFDVIENAPGRDISFEEYLERQLTYMHLDERERFLAARIIYNLDNNGYMTMPLRETLEEDLDPPVSDEDLDGALFMVQHLDPPGVGARTIKECLLLQIDAIGEAHPLEREIVLHHLEDLAANRLPQIARSMSCSIEDVKQAAQFIRTLNPHPGMEYKPVSASHVTPDVMCEVDEEDNWDVRLVGSTQPDISDMFLAMFDTTKRGKQLREKVLADPDRAEEFKQMQALLKNSDQGKMLREKYQSARWLVTAIAQRERTLLRVSKSIVERQKDYLAGLSDAPAPLMMQEVAEVVGIDISTVSRAVRDKYMETPLGLKPLRMFFTRSVGGSRPGSSENSNVHIMNRIKEMIEQEDKKKPLKDDQILSKLKEEGIDIKRRTVAKYRANLGFLSHSKRREY